MTTKKPNIKIAVREFAVPTRRKGSFASQESSGLTLDVGNELHSLIMQRLAEENDSYESEHPLNFRFELDKVCITVSGRCDGLLHEQSDIFSDSPPLIFEEIKTSYHIESLKHQLDQEFLHPYRLQLLCYQWIGARFREQAPRARLRLVCSRTKKEEFYLHELEHTDDRFQLWLDQRLKQIEQEYLNLQDLKKRRKSLAKEIAFPFKTKRAEQEQLIKQMDEKISSYREFLIQAPTGLGKTAGISFPSLRKCLEKAAPLVYVTPKNSQFEALKDFCLALKKQTPDLKVLVLTSRSKACLNEELTCRELSCAYAQNYYDKLEVLEIPTHSDKLWDKNYFSNFAKENLVCPYELSFERLREADIILCDYNYVVSLRGNLIERYNHPYLNYPKPFLVIDEAHNLHHRAIENFSPKLDESAIESLRSQEDMNEDLENLIQLAKSCLDPKVEVKQLRLLHESMKSYVLELLAEGEYIGFEEPIFLLFSSLEEMLLLINQELDSTRLVNYLKDPSKTRITQLICLDPSEILKGLFSQFQKVIAFSATLKPFEFYQNILGFEDCFMREFSSPFGKEQKKILIIPQISTKLRLRHLHYERIAEVIKRTTRIKDGHYLVFLPSYQFLRELSVRLSKCLEDFELLEQSDSNVSELLEKIKSKQGKQKIVLAVQGGALSEGIDFRGWGIKGAYIVGPALPAINFHSELMLKHFNQKKLPGRSYTYTFPAMTKAVQAAGRVVRDYDERAIIVLMDARFLQAEFSQAMPDDWFLDSPQELLSNHILRDIDEFWKMPPLSH